MTTRLNCMPHGELRGWGGLQHIRQVRPCSVLRWWYWRETRVTGWHGSLCRAGSFRVCCLLEGLEPEGAGVIDSYKSHPAKREEEGGCWLVALCTLLMHAYVRGPFVCGDRSDVPEHDVLNAQMERPA